MGAVRHSAGGGPVGGSFTATSNKTANIHQAGCAVRVVVGLKLPSLAFAVSAGCGYGSPAKCSQENG